MNEQIMKLIYTLLFVCCISAFAQKQYTFDYIIEYKTTNFNQKLNKNWTMYLLTNSKDGSYHASLTEKDSLNYFLIFNDYYNYSSGVIISKKDFMKGEFINIKCADISDLNNRKPLNKGKSISYAFSIANDTIFQNKDCFEYAIDVSNVKLKKRQKVGHEQYIIDKETAFHVPIFLHNAFYKNAKTSVKIPNGIYLKKVNYNYLNEPISIEERIDYLPTNKKIVISTDCK